MISALRWAGICFVLAASGCRNNTIELETDSDESDGTASGTDTQATRGDDDGGTRTTGRDETDDTAPVSGFGGNWLLIVDTVLQPGLPLQFLVTSTETSPGTYDLTLQSLSLDPGSTTAPRQLVGSPYSYFGVPLSDTMDLVFYTGQIAIPANANPGTATDMTIDISLIGPAAGDPFCGNVGGSVVSPAPADLTGSTFATVRVDGVGSLPTTFPFGC